MVLLKSSASSGAHIIVFGNEKGGSGKSTCAMHAAVALLRMGYKVGTIDLDARQGTLTRYFKNRFEFIARHRIDLPSPMHMPVLKSDAVVLQDRHKQERDFLMMAMDELHQSCDFVVIDTPGTDSYLSRVAHSYAGTLVTPMNDSFVDIDLLVDLNPQTFQVRKIPVYTEMVRKQTALKYARDYKHTDWIVVRNRLSHLNARNKRDVTEVLESIGTFCGFRLGPGFGDRVIFKELFLKGLTLLDMEDDPEHEGMNTSHLAARQEVRNFMAAIDPEQYKPLTQKEKEMSSRV